MAKVQIRVSAKGVREASKKLKALVERLQNPTPIMNEIANYMVRVTQNRLTTTKIGPDGKKWVKNTLLTQQLKGGNQPLYASGALASSISIIRKDRFGFSVGTKLDYASYNQEGVETIRGKYKSKKPSPQIPPRPFSGFSETNKVKIFQMMRNYIRDGRDTFEEDR